MSENPRSVLWKCLCALVCLGVFAFLATRVADKAHPWEKVLVIENGLEGNDFAAQSMGRRKIACFSPDEKTLFVTTANGTIQAWDIEKKLLKNTFGVPLNPDPDEDAKHLRGAWNIEINDLNQVVESRWDHDEKGKITVRLLIHTMEGELVSQHRFDAFYKAFSISKDGQWLAGGQIEPSVTNFKTGEKISLSPKRGFNGGFRRYQWSKDGKKLLFSEALMFCIYDTLDWKNAIVARTRYIDIANEGLKELDAPVDKNRRWQAALMDTQFVDGDRKVASIYNANGWDMGPANPDENVLRFTSVETGELLKSIQLPYEPRSMWVSEDGKQVYVTMCPDFTTVLSIYDAESMVELETVFSKVSNSFPTQAMSMNGEGNHIVQYSNGAVMQDWGESYTPVRFEPLENLVIQVMTNKRSDLLVTVLNSRELHVWKKRREPSKWGAFVLWEYGVSYLCMLVLFLLPLYWTKKASDGSSLEGKRPLRKVEWFLLVISAITLSITLVRIIYEPIFGDIWLYADEGVSTPAVFGFMLSFCCYLGLLWRNDAWRKVNRILCLLGGIMIFGLLIYLFVLIINIDADVFILTVAESSADGLQWDLTTQSILLWSFLTSVYLFFKFWVLRVPFKH